MICVLESLVVPSIWVTLEGSSCLPHIALPGHSRHRMAVPGPQWWAQHNGKGQGGS